MKFEGYHGVMRPEHGSADLWETIECGHCGARGPAMVIASGHYTESPRWLQCTSCGHGTYISENNEQVPKRPFGPDVLGCPAEVEAAYDEARKTLSVNAFTACDLICRKILMYVGVDKGAEEGQTFVHYIEHLQNTGYVTPSMRKWVDIIRSHGNDATHKIAARTQDQAEGTLMFTAELLRLVYEMEHLARKYAKPGKG